MGGFRKQMVVLMQPGLPEEHPCFAIDCEETRERWELRGTLFFDHGQGYSRLCVSRGCRGVCLESRRRTLSVNHLAGTPIDCALSLTMCNEGDYSTTILLE